jgi:2-deoxy-D-gluconate 3-dehydrogenase
MTNPFSLHGQRALVTGANTGIGQAIAIGLAAAGADVVCAGRSASDETVNRITKAGGTAASCHVDLTNPMAGQELFAGQGFNILINNAGIIKRSDAVEATEADWDAVMDVNLKSLFFTTQAFGKECLAKGRFGRVVNIASLLSFQGGIRVAAYTASKHGVAGLTNEWAAKGVNVNAIAPGYIATNNTAALRADTARNAAILDRIPAGHWGKPEDISGTAVYLCSPAASYVHGTILNVDGGWLAR